MKQSVSLLVEPGANKGVVLALFDVILDPVETLVHGLGFALFEPRLLANPSVVELLIWTGVADWGWPISSRVIRIMGTPSLALLNISDPRSALAAEDTTLGTVADARGEKSASAFLVFVFVGGFIAKAWKPEWRLRASISEGCDASLCVLRSMSLVRCRLIASA